MASEVFLRDVKESDLPIFFDQQLDPEATRMAAFPSRDHEAFMAHWTKSMADKTVVLQTILCDGSVAGNIVCWRQSDERLVGYWLGREYWGKGVASAALSLFLAHVTIRPLVAHVAKHNIASVRVLQKCGFTISGENASSSPDGGYGVSLGVHPGFRRRGVATVLVQHLEEVAAESGCHAIVLHTVLETGNVVIFEGMGFVTESRQPTDLFESDAFPILSEVVMRKDLPR